jgi:hypothetical protein
LTRDPSREGKASRDEYCERRDVSRVRASKLRRSADGRAVVLAASGFPELFVDHMTANPQFEAAHGEQG